MTDPLDSPGSENPNAPDIPQWLSNEERMYLIGYLISAILYGIVVVLFFRCMLALLNPFNPTRTSVNWKLAVHTTLMFSVLTITTAMNLFQRSLCYIDNREFPGAPSLPVPGPLGYQTVTYDQPITDLPNIMFHINQWLSDGLLLYRCHVIYGMNYWVTAFPFLLYLASLVTGIIVTYLNLHPNSNFSNVADVYSFHLSYDWIFVLLNILLTLMIIARLVLHSRNFRNAAGASRAATGLYKTIITMLIESFALHGLTSFVYLVLGVVNSPVTDLLNPVVPATQVMAPFLIILRVAERRALTSNEITSGKLGSIRFRSRGESTYDDGPLSGRDPTSSTNGEVPGELAGAGNVAEEEGLSDY